MCAWLKWSYDHKMIYCVPKKLLLYYQGHKHVFFVGKYLTAEYVIYIIWILFIQIYDYDSDTIFKLIIILMVNNTFYKCVLENKC